MSIISGVGSSATVGAANGGKTWPNNGVTTVFSQVIGANPSRKKISFHNPGTNNLYVGPMQVVQNVGPPQNFIPNAPSLASLGGSYILFPGGLIEFSGECQLAWGALASTGSTNPLTITESNV